VSKNGWFFVKIFIAPAFDWGPVASWRQSGKLENSANHWRMQPMLMPLLLALSTAHEDELAANLADRLKDHLAFVQHGSKGSIERATLDIFRLAVESTSSGGQPIAFRHACFSMGIVDVLVDLIAQPSTTERTRQWALAALAAIATDDPQTDTDNEHAAAVCAAGAVPHIVRDLSSPNRDVVLSAAGCCAALAEEPQCQLELLHSGAAAVLVALSTYGASDGVRQTALAALHQLAVNPNGRKAIIFAGGSELMRQLSKYDISLRQQTADVSTLLRKELTHSGKDVERGEEVDTATHVQRAHATRLKYSKLWDQAGVYRAYGPQRLSSP